MLKCPICDGENVFIEKAEKLVAVCRVDGHLFQYEPKDCPPTSDLNALLKARCDSKPGRAEYVKRLCCWPENPKELAWPLTPEVRYQKLYNMTVAAEYAGPKFTGEPMQYEPYLQYDFSERDLERLYKPKAPLKPVSTPDTWPKELPPSKPKAKPKPKRQQKHGN